ncbi:hypothetical protein GCM10009733_040030 [Nonomuraea maheshkhaliensis]|uniref:Beta-ketoacyl synthase N-terminal domain-containing protein n=1 Tax=Nonomuraea maheshkhaliensis TaxID=419590 RepID=A0ABN2FBE5_9ACTN
MITASSSAARRPPFGLSSMVDQRAGRGRPFSAVERPDHDSPRPLAPGPLVAMAGGFGRLGEATALWKIVRRWQTANRGGLRFLHVRHPNVRGYPPTRAATPPK